MYKSRIVLVLLVGPGAGKGTQAQALMRYLEIPQISTGDLLRAEIKQKTEVGIEAEKQIYAAPLEGVATRARRAAVTRLQPSRSTPTHPGN